MLGRKDEAQSASDPDPDLCPNYSWVSFLFHMSPEKWRLVTDKNQTSPKIKCVCDLDSSLSLAVTANVLNDLLMLSTRSTYV